MAKVGTSSENIEGHRLDFIQNSDNTPYITLGTWGLGVDLMGGLGCALPRIHRFTTPTTTPPKNRGPRQKKNSTSLGKFK